jgi:hypothetical protein
VGSLPTIFIVSVTAPFMHAYTMVPKEQMVATMKNTFFQETSMHSGFEKIRQSLKVDITTVFVLEFN